MLPQQPLTDAERTRYEWQLWIDGFGAAQQERLKGAAVLVSRVGGVGGALAQQLAAAGVGKLVLAHAGDLQLSDLNRQILMSEAGIGQARVTQAAQRLQALHSGLEVVPVTENINQANAEPLVRQVDLIASCAPLFAERLLLNQAAIALNKPLVDCAMYEWEVQLTTVVPGQTPCLACLYPQPPPAWKRQFPVLGAVSGTVGCLGAIEVIKLLTGLGQPLHNQMLLGDLRTMSFRKTSIARRADCQVCAGRR